jgi:cytochrome c oxidase cbb3-type subunit 4
MSMDVAEIQAMIHSYWTVLMLVIFVGIWIWAWGKGRKKSFDEASRLPLDEDNNTQPAEREVKNQ